MDRLASLNPAQRKAVQTLSGPLLVLAGAGTGKTRVITYRMVELIRSGIPPSRILSVTFTNKAAREMRERTLALLGKKTRQRPLISTFHSLCVRILRQEIHQLGYPNQFTIYDRGDQESAARTALREIRVGDSALRPGDLLNAISRWKMSGIAPDRAADHVVNDQDFLAALAYRKYQANLRAAGGVDFDDLLLLTNELFRQFPDSLNKYQSAFDHVQIDEYQDTNGSQFELVTALVAGHGNLCVVGDDDQAIYGWRGAEVEHILGFDRQFAGATVIRLEDNYRCTDRIITVANRLVSHNRGRHAKVLIAHKVNGEPVKLIEFPDEQTEAREVVSEIAYFIRELEVPKREFAILFRTNEQHRLFETELRRQRVPYVLMGTQSFFDRREIRDLLAYLKAIAFPKDEQALLRIINVPARGIGTASVEKILQRAVADGTAFWDAVAPLQAAGQITPRTAASVDNFRQLLLKYRAAFQERPHELPELTERLIREVDYDSEIVKQYKDADQQTLRREMVQAFVNSVAQYLEAADDPSLAEYLNEAALNGREEEPDKDEQAAEDAVKLMTLHSAKGLEFPRVYLVGMEEGLLPHRRSIDATEKEISEERRLAYVGVTRAMDVLTLTRAASRMKWGKRRPSLPSRFLFEMRDPDAAESNSDHVAAAESDPAH